MGDKNLSILFVDDPRKNLETALTGVGVFHILFPIYSWTIRQDLMVRPYTLLMQ